MSEAALPAFVNPSAGTGRKAREALEAAGTFSVRDIAPDSLDDALRRAIDDGARRIVIAGGDGTIATAAAIVAGTPVELAIVPGGTLNHFARDHGIPTDHAEAARLAAVGSTLSADVAYVGERLFLNTSSVGAYVLFVRARERFERRFGYRLASILAAVRLLGRVRSFVVEVEIDGQVRMFRTSLVFIAVGERELRIPTLGARMAGGRRGLHVMVVRGGTAARLFAIGIATLARGVRAVSRTDALESFIVDRVRIDLPRPRGNVAVDGELVSMTTPLEYRVARDAVRLVAPEPVPAAR